jgi:hypothetical protein
MNIWNMLGLSPQQGLLAVTAALATTCLLAARVILQRSRVPQKSALGLLDRKVDR